jgi:protein SCO1/2
MGLKSFLWLIVFLFAWLWIPSTWVVIYPEAKASPQTRLSRDEKNIRYFTDLKVMTHEGEELRFYSDILKDKLVVISFFYTNCPTAQPTLATFFRLQKRLRDRLSKDIVLLTISVDPEKDTPAAVRKYARKFNPQKGWFFLTGKTETMEIINRRLGNTGPLPQGHLRLFLMGNLRTGHWMKLVETAPEIALAQGLHSLTLED